MKLLNNNKPDLIFLDISLPKKSGIKCLKEIKGNKEFADIPVIILSISSDESDIEKAYSQGANMYITKPFAFDTEVRVLRKIFATDWKEYKPQPSKDKFVLCTSAL